MRNPKPPKTPNSSKVVTVRDIAAHLDIHFTTVAAALRDSPKVKEDTKQKVIEVATSLGYRADPMLTALSAYRTGSKAPAFQGVLAWVNLFDTPDYFTESKNKFYTEVFKGAAKRAEVLGYKFESFWMREPGMTAKRASQILDSRNVAGVIVGPMPYGIDDINLYWEKFCSVRIGYSLEETELTTVTADQFGNMKRLFQKLLDDGFRKIGFTSPQRIDNRTNNHWSGAFCAMQLRYFGEIVVPPLLNVQKDEGFIEWYRKYQPDVIITSALNVHLPLLEQNDIKVPHETQIVSLHADTDDIQSTPSGIQQNGLIVGKISVDQLVAIIHRLKTGVETHPKTVTIAGEWHGGEHYDPSLRTKRFPQS